MNIITLKQIDKMIVEHLGDNNFNVENFDRYKEFSADDWSGYKYVAVVKEVDGDYDEDNSWLGDADFIPGVKYGTQEPQWFEDETTDDKSEAIFIANSRAKEMAQRDSEEQEMELNNNQYSEDEDNEDGDEDLEQHGTVYQNITNESYEIEKKLTLKKIDNLIKETLKNAGENTILNIICRCGHCYRINALDLSKTICQKCKKHDVRDYNIYEESPEQTNDADKDNLNITGDKMRESNILTFKYLDKLIKESIVSARHYVRSQKGNWYKTNPNLKYSQPNEEDDTDTDYSLYNYEPSPIKTDDIYDYESNPMEIGDLNNINKNNINIAGRIGESKNINKQNIKNLIEATVRHAMEPSYEMNTDFDLDDEPEEEIEPYRGAPPKRKFEHTRDIPFTSYNNEYKKLLNGDTVVYQEPHYLDNSLMLTVHGTVVGQLGSVVKVLVDTFERRGKLFRLPGKKIEFILQNKLETEFAPPSKKMAELTEHM